MYKQISIMSFYSKCFDLHPFHELNNIDNEKLRHIVDRFLKTHKLRQDSVFVDVGCNAGSFVKVLQEANISNNIHCFEPHPILSKKVKEVYPYVIMNEYCLSNYNGYINIHIPSLSVGLSSIIKRPVFNTLQQEIMSLETKVQTLDTYCQTNKIECIDFIKIDVEGAEKTVLEGAHCLLSTHRIKAGQFEVGNTLVDAGTSTEEVCAFIEKYGYKIDKIYDTDYYFYIDK
jgi:FkbM family methyltransferase